MNLLAKFKKLLPSDPLMVGTVTAHNADGSSTLETLAGGTVRVQGQSVAVDSMAFYRAGRIEGEAPELDAYELEV